MNRHSTLSSDTHSAPSNLDGVGCSDQDTTDITTLGRTPRGIPVRFEFGFRLFYISNGDRIARNDRTRARVDRVRIGPRLHKLERRARRRTGDRVRVAHFDLARLARGRLARTPPAVGPRRAKEEDDALGQAHAEREQTPQGETQSVPPRLSLSLSLFANSGRLMLATKTSSRARLVEHLNCRTTCATLVTSRSGGSITGKPRRSSRLLTSDRGGPSCHVMEKPYSRLFALSRAQTPRLSRFPPVSSFFSRSLLSLLRPPTLFGPHCPFVPLSRSKSPRQQ